MDIGKIKMTYCNGYKQAIRDVVDRMIEFKNYYTQKNFSQPINLVELEKDTGDAGIIKGINFSLRCVELALQKKINEKENQKLEALDNFKNTLENREISIKSLKDLFPLFRELFGDAIKDDISK